MAASPLLRQPAFNPQFRDESTPRETAIDMELNRTEMLIIFDDLISAIREQNKPTKRLLRRVVDAIFWKIFQMMAIITIVLVCSSCLYMMYFFLYKDEVDSVAARVESYYIEFSTTVTALVRVIEKVCEILATIDSRAAKAAEIAVEELQRDDDPLDALFLAVN